jgi:hypothetical protein
MSCQQILRQNQHAIGLLCCRDAMVGIFMHTDETYFNGVRVFRCTNIFNHEPEKRYSIR